MSSEPFPMGNDVQTDYLIQKDILAKKLGVTIM